MKHGAKTVAGEKRNRLTAIKLVGRDKFNGMLWEFKCDCGNSIITQLSKFRRGTTKRCNQCNPYFKYTIGPMRSLWKKVYSDGCSFETFERLSKLNCFYCNKEPSNYHCGIVYNGLDRIDSARDHSEDNIVPCCANCNRAKMAMSYDDFLDMIQRIYHYRICPKI
jgi:hypothetical protein